jgi:hypothetical protein
MQSQAAPIWNHLVARARAEAVAFNKTLDAMRRIAPRVSAEQGWNLTEADIAAIARISMYCAMGPRKPWWNR